MSAISCHIVQCCKRAIFLLPSCVSVLSQRFEFDYCLEGAESCHIVEEMCCPVLRYCDGEEINVLSPIRRIIIGIIVGGT